MYSARTLCGWQAQLRKSWQQAPANGEHAAGEASGAGAGWDVVRSGGPSIASEELPTEGTARSALSVFQQKEAERKSAAAAPPLRHEFRHQVDDVRSSASASCTRTVVK